ncbi:MAG: leucine--tRNA ligase, partial [Cyclobacteriaceae bacterium]|nr:leucine--tRNA ligase [Cyclobacteriaceae bacterium]
MAAYNFREIEQKWQKYWADHEVFKSDIDHHKPKYYVLDMFPYPSGSGLHVGHPLGYIATDIVARFKRLKGFNVLHPMGFDAFGLPAEQYAIQTGQHPAVTTSENIIRYKSQLKNLGFCFDWDKEVQTCDPAYYKWTQWIFLELFNSWYDKKENKARSIDELISLFETEGNNTIEAACDEDTPLFTASDWASYDEKERHELLNHYRLTYPAEALVNWCPELGTVLANDEIKDGFSERGGYPVERKKMKQWMMRITAYADRLADNLSQLDWSSSMKDMQTNWIGKSHGCELDFQVEGKDFSLKAFTTRPDTIYGVTYVVIAPEHELVSELTTTDRTAEVEQYVAKASNRSERERMAETKSISGVFTGSYVINPYNNKKVPLWVADYVLHGYGTGVVMAVPSSDDRDFRFAQHFNLDIIRVIEGTEQMDDPTTIKHGKMINSGDLNGMDSKEAILKTIKQAEDRGIGKARVNYKIRDAVFSRQRYWGEPVPIYYEDGIARPIPFDELPLILPEIDEYKPTETGEAPLARATAWKYKGKYEYEYTTMPGWAGSSWYFLRYMDARNTDTFVSREAADYWNQVDLYIGGTEHAAGHLLYSRFWNMVLFDRGFIGHEEPFKKLVNQGMIQGRSSLAYRVNGTNQFVSYNLRKNYDCSPLHVDVSLVKNDLLDIEAFRNWRPDLHDASFIMEEEKFYCGSEVEKMSKRLFNVVNPDDIIAQYGSDTLRLYEMFLGPIEQSKPWDTHG